MSTLKEQQTAQQTLAEMQTAVEEGKGTNPSTGLINLERAKAMIQKIAASEVVDDEMLPGEKYFDVTMKQVVSRDADGKLFIHPEGEKEKVPVDINDPKFAQYFGQPNKCFSLGFKKSDGNCATLFECLVDNNLENTDCLAALRASKDGFFAQAKEEIGAIHPVLALRVLQQFGFKKYHDRLDGLWKVQNVDHWLRSTVNDNSQLQTLMRDDASKQILQYLNLVAGYVNSNPAILNKGHVTVSASSEVPELVKRLGLSQELPAGSGSSMTHDALRLKQHLGFARLTRPFAYSRGMGLTTPFGTGFGPGGQMLRVQGGGGGQCENVIRKMSSSGNVTSGAVIANFFESLKTALRNRGVQLNGGDAQRLGAKIAQLQDIESELLKTLCLMDTFNSVKDQMPGQSSGMLSTDQMETIINRYDKLLNKQGAVEESLLNAIIKIDDLSKNDLRPLLR